MGDPGTSPCWQADFQLKKGNPRIAAGEGDRESAGDLDLLEGGAHIVLIHDFADALAAAAPGCLEHDGIPYLGTAFQRFLQAVDACLHPMNPISVQKARSDSKGAQKSLCIFMAARMTGS